MSERTAACEMIADRLNQEYLNGKRNQRPKRRWAYDINEIKP